MQSLVHVTQPHVWLKNQHGSNVQEYFSQFGFLSAALRLDQTKRNEILRFKSICGLFTGVVRRNSIYNNEYNQEILRGVGMYKLNY